MNKNLRNLLIAFTLIAAFLAGFAYHAVAGTWLCCWEDPASGQSICTAGPITQDCDGDIVWCNEWTTNPSGGGYCNDS